jgi:hypothetical protein
MLALSVKDLGKAVLSKLPLVLLIVDADGVECCTHTFAQELHGHRSPLPAAGQQYLAVHQVSLLSTVLGHKELPDLGHDAIVEWSAS